MSEATVVRCKHKDCQKVLTQAYAIERGECLECLQKRMHASYDTRFYYTSASGRSYKRSRKAGAA